MKYDKIFMTPGPSFYKNKLFNEVAKHIKICVLYTGSGNDRNADFYRGELAFNHIELPRSFKNQVKTMRQFLKDNSYTEIVFGGWDNKITWWMLFHSPKKKNACIFESSVSESKVSGYRGWLKKLFLSRLSKAYPSGKLQAALLKNLGFKGYIIEYGGCGILNYLPQPAYSKRNAVKNYIYVGRLVEVKNLTLLIRVFNQLPHLQLTIVGFGVLEQQLKALAGNNIFFKGAVENEKLPELYKQSDVFVLPSKSESWGLVVEEALNNGTPVVVSSAVGCRADLVTDKTGVVFESNNEKSLKEAILKMSDVAFYNKLREGVSRLNFQERAQRQINSFL